MRLRHSQVLGQFRYTTMLGTTKLCQIGNKHIHQPVFFTRLHQLFFALLGGQLTSRLTKEAPCPPPDAAANSISTRGADRLRVLPPQGLR